MIIIKTTVVNRHFEPYDVYIGLGTRYGNPFVSSNSREEALELYKQYARNNEDIMDNIEELRGKRLGCSCKPRACHGDILVEILNEIEEGKVMSKKKYKKIVLGIDQSYTNTGITLVADGEIKVCTSTKYFKGLKTKTEKRNYVKHLVKNILEKNVGKSDEFEVLVERMRTFNKGKNGSPDSLGKVQSIPYIKATASLIACIVDVAYDFDIKVYSVDTRAWKSRVVGTSKPKPNKYGVDPNKWATILFVKKELGIDVSFRSPRGLLKFDDDRADSACIALYGFQKVQNKILEE